MVNMKLVKQILNVLGFISENGRSNIYIKDYDGYKIIIEYNPLDEKKSKINYGSKIKVDRKTTSNFNQTESFVVLECVDRLLKKGYRPEDITLEKAFKAGRKACYLDILVKDLNGSSYLMIECKRWGEEYEQEKNKMFKDGGQLLSYYKEDKNTKFLCLYSSKIDNNLITYKSEFISSENLKGNNLEEIFENWNQTFLKKGLFEDDVAPYDYKSSGLTYSDLQELKKSDGGTIFNQFAEILRRHIVSDKTNAFNKIFNLFICKIQDEDNNYYKPYNELSFQYKELDNKEKLFDRLNVLYKQGNRNYIKIDLPDVSEEDFCKLLELANNENLRKAFNDLRYYRSSQEFSFKEVYNKETFEENADIVIEVVKLLENYKIKYSSKHQYLGDFFELLLNTGIKQEAGQFFTPIPIARFICKSLPIQDIINEKNNNKEEHFLPYVIDYACGSGHFLTEVMDEIDSYVQKININDINGSKTAVDNFASEKNNYKWTKEYIYGIEKDYRLVKTSKISSFLNGDGEANVISGDGLAPFNDPKYIGLLKTAEFQKDNNQFDILIANPPYSISAFKNTLKNGAKSFDLYKNLTDRSSEIECLFIERATQLLKIKYGVAGIILPISILTNSGIYEKAREILLKNFDIIAIQKLGDNAFMATGTKTVILFLRKKDEAIFKEIKKLVDKFFYDFQDITINNIENAFSCYLRYVYNDLTLAEYIGIIKCNENKNTEIKELSKEYKNLSSEKRIALEKEKVIYFILSYNQKIVLGDSLSKDEEKEFYGYEFSNRKGNEGIHLYLNKGKLNSKLYNSENLYDTEKVNSYILDAFKGVDLTNKFNEIKSNNEHPLHKHLDYIRLVDCMDFERKDFDKGININRKKKIRIKSQFRTLKIKYIPELEIKKGTSIVEKKIKKGEVPVIAGGLEPAYYIDKPNRSAGVITVSTSGANAGFVNFYNIPIFASDCFTIQSQDEDILLSKYVYYILKNFQEYIFSLQEGKSQPHVYSSDVEEIRIPVPPINIQKVFVEKLNQMEEAEKGLLSKINIFKNKINALLEFDSNVKLEPLKNYADVMGGKRVSKGYRLLSEKTEHPYIRVSDFKNNSISLDHIKYISDEMYKKISKYVINTNEIYISIAGTIGLTGLCPESLNGANLTENAAKIVINTSNINNIYLSYLLKSSFLVEQIKEFTHTLGTPKLSLKNIRNLKIPLLDPSKQKEIVNQIEPLEKEIIRLTDQLEIIKKERETVIKNFLF